VGQPLVLPLVPGGSGGSLIIRPTVTTTAARATRHAVDLIGHVLGQVGQAIVGLCLGHRARLDGGVDLGGVRGDDGRRKRQADELFERPAAVYRINSGKHCQLPSAHASLVRPGGRRPCDHRARRQEEVMGAIAVPILPGKLSAWREWGEEMNGARRADLEDLNTRHGLTRHRAYLQRNPDGSYLIIAVHDGPGGDDLMSALARSSHPFDRWFVEHVADVHGIRSSDSPPVPELVLDSIGAPAAMSAAAPAGTGAGTDAR
jgi:hypothetical protein